MPTDKGIIFDEDLRLKLRSFLGLDLDKAICDMLAFIITNEPTTLYRISKSTSYGISTVYKKARKMLKDGLIKCAYSGEAGCLYEATVKGLLACLSYSCLDDTLVLRKLHLRWHKFVLNGLALVIALLPNALGREDVGMLENNGYVIERVKSFINLRPDDVQKAIIGIRGLRLLRGNGFLLSICDSDIIIVNCMLCEKRCFMTRPNGNCLLSKYALEIIDY